MRTIRRTIIAVTVPLVVLFSVSQFRVVYCAFFDNYFMSYRGVVSFGTIDDHGGQFMDDGLAIAALRIGVWYPNYFLTPRILDDNVGCMAFASWGIIGAAWLGIAVPLWLLWRRKRRKPAAFPVETVETGERNGPNPANHRAA